MGTKICSVSDKKVIKSNGNKLMAEACITDIQRFSIHDGPGIRTLVFFKGCSLRCRWCQNPECINLKPELKFDVESCIGCLKCIKACKRNAISISGGVLITDKNLCISCGLCTKVCYSKARELVGKSRTVKEVYEIVKRDKIFYENSGGGITLSGGEPLLNWKFSVDLLKKCKDNGINTAMETSGYALWKNFKSVLRYIDYLLIDIKHINPDIHKKYTGKSNKIILENLSKISGLNKKVFIRYPLIPGINDDGYVLKGIAKIARDINAVEVHVLPYHLFGVSKYKALNKNYLLSSLEPSPEEQVLKVKGILGKEGVRVNVGGIISIQNLKLC
jgi:pyruvate formate lyase activating enzyme